MKVKKKFIRNAIMELEAIQDIASEMIDSLETRRRVLLKMLSEID